MILLISLVDTVEKMETWFWRLRYFDISGIIDYMDGTKTRIYKIDEELIR